VIYDVIGVRIALVSADNSKVVRTGDKHVHKDLLEKALKRLRYGVETFYSTLFEGLDKRDRLKTFI